MLAVPAPAPVCPIQTITVINKSQARPAAIRKFERAAVDQSRQIHHWWGTPCVRFGTGGWLLTLRRGTNPDYQGVHFSDPVRMIVQTGGAHVEFWALPALHEIAETLVDPVNTAYYVNRSIAALEIADPVYKRPAYRLDGVWAPDFTTPNYYAGAQWAIGTCPTAVGDTITCNSPQISPSNNTGPYDQAGRLHRPWS